MKKTRKTLSLVALLLVAVTLLSSCGINYRKTDVSKYVTIGDTGYKGVALEVNKTIISDRDVEKSLFTLLYNNRTVVDETKDATIDKSAIKQHDTLALRLAIYDDKMNLVFSQFGLDSSAYNEKDTAQGGSAIKGTLAAVPGLSFDVGYGEFGRKEVTLDATNKITLPVDFLNGLEAKIYGEGATHTSIDDFKIEDRWNHNTTTEGDVLNTVDTPLKGFFSVSYLPSYTKAGSTTPILGSTVAPATIDTYLYENKTEKGKNDFLEAIYLGLVEYEKKMVKNEAPLTCGKTIMIHVVPTDVLDEDLTADEKKLLDPTDKSLTDQVLVKYDLDFENPSKGTAYKRGKISTGILFAYAQQVDEGSETGYAEPITMEFKPGENYEGKYKVGSTEEKMAEKTFTVRIFVEKRTAYDFATEEADVAKLIKEKGGHDHMGDLSGLTDKDLIDKYKAHLKKEMQEEADKQADKDAKDALWKKVVAASKEGKKSARSFAKQYVKEEVNYLKYMYYDYQNGAYKALADSFKKFAVQYVNWGFEAHYTELLKTYIEADKDGKYSLPLADTTDASYEAAYRQLESIFYEEGLAIAKERALVYLLADKLGVRMSEDELEAKLAAAVKKANDDALESIRDTITVDEGELEEDVKKTLIDALKQIGVTESKIKNLPVKGLAKHYLLQYYGVSSFDELPKEMVTEKSYLSQVDKEGLFGGYQLEKVKNTLFETNKSTITFVEVDTDGNKLDKEADGK